LPFPNDKDFISMKREQSGMLQTNRVAPFFKTEN
jgi:hypothetical protein